MKGRVRKNQWIEGVIYNDSQIMLMEKPTKYVADRIANQKKARTTVIVCDNTHLKVGEMTDEGYTARCVMAHDAGMYWRNYEQYFYTFNVRVLTCYLKADSDLEEAACQLADYIIMNEVEDKVLLVGFAEAGIFMYDVATKLPLGTRRQVSVITVAAPFSQHRNMEALSNYKKHIAFINVSDRMKLVKKNFFSKPVEEFDGMPIKEQDGWPVTENGKVREPDMKLVCYTPLSEALETVLSDFGRYAGGDALFAKVDEFKECDIVKNMLK